MGADDRPLADPRAGMHAGSRIDVRGTGSIAISSSASVTRCEPT